MLPDSKKMNRGPEVYSPDDLKTEYSRQERLEMTRVPGKRGGGAGRRYSMRIMLLDLLLLCIIGGIIYPFIINRNRTGTLEGVSCSLSVRNWDDEILVSVRMRSSDKITGQVPFDMSVFLNGSSVRTLTDMTPPAGEERVVRITSPVSPKKVAVKVLVSINDRELELNTVTNPGQ